MSPVRFANRPGYAAYACVAGLMVGLAAPAAAGQSLETVTIRGKPQTVHLYGVRGRPPVVVSSVKASNHRFSDNVAEFDRRLLEAMAWVARGGR